MSHSTAVFLAAAGLIGLHIVDDSFVQPQPGTSALDHLASGLIPLALLGLMATARLEDRRALRAELREPLTRRDARRPTRTILQRHPLSLHVPLASFSDDP